MKNICDSDGKILHRIVRKSEIAKGRTNLCEDNRFLQCAALQLQAGDTFKPHQHKWKVSDMPVIAQESWVVISGRVRVIFYDTKGNIIDTQWLYAGDLSFTFEGGHNYEILEQGTFVYEFKTGPYTGQENDKIFI